MVSGVTGTVTSVRLRLRLYVLIPAKRSSEDMRNVFCLMHPARGYHFESYTVAKCFLAVATLLALSGSAEAFSAALAMNVQSGQCAKKYLDDTGGLWHLVKHVPLPADRLKLTQDLAKNLPPFKVVVGERANCCSFCSQKMTASRQAPPENKTAHICPGAYFSKISVSVKKFVFGRWEE